MSLPGGSLRRRAARENERRSLPIEAETTPAGENAYRPRVEALSDKEVEHALLDISVPHRCSYCGHSGLWGNCLCGCRCCADTVLLLSDFLRPVIVQASVSSGLNVKREMKRIAYYRKDGSSATRNSERPDKCPALWASETDLPAPGC